MPGTAPEFKPHALVIELRAPVPAIESLLRVEYGARVKREGTSRLRVGLAPGHDPGAVLRRIETDPSVEFAERVPIIRRPVERALSDTQMLEQPADLPIPFGVASLAAPAAPRRAPARPVYAFRQHGFWPIENIRRPEAWSELSLNNLAVLDSGCDASHPGLAGRVDFGDKASRQDGYGHGTFVCYMLVGAGQEEPAVPPGVLPASRVWNANVFEAIDLGDGNFDYTVDEVRLSAWLRKLAARSTPRLKKVDVVNLSLGTSYPSKAIRKDVKAVVDAGIVVVASAGNSPADSSIPVMYPAAYPEVISVGALAYSDGGDRIWERSNYELDGETKRTEPWDLCAPGACVLSGLPAAANALGVEHSGWMSGTSMAAPYVAAAAAVLCHQGVRGREDVLGRLREIGRRNENFVSLVCPQRPAPMWTS